MTADDGMVYGEYTPPRRYVPAEGPATVTLCPNCGDAITVGHHNSVCLPALAARVRALTAELAAARVREAELFDSAVRCKRERNAAERVIANVRALHRRSDSPSGFCIGCHDGARTDTHPCATVALLPAAPTEGPATVTRCWRSECSRGCYYPDACSEKPAAGPATVTPAAECGCGITREHTPQECEGPATVTLTETERAMYEPVLGTSNTYLTRTWEVTERIVAARVGALTADNAGWRATVNVERARADALTADLAAARAERDVIREAVAVMVRDHTMPPNKDRRGYDYRMGWWDAVTYLDTLVKRRLRALLSAAPTDSGPQGSGPTEEATP